VAEAASNLAILYNQRGDFGAAQPLYERALAIYEATFGPEHSDVAHTLTDLAVLHLENVGGWLPGWGLAGWLAGCLAGGWLRNCGRGLGSWVLRDTAKN
jgi:hypothetical protein